MRCMARERRSLLNLVRWISLRTIKETFAPPHPFEYPFMAEK